MRHRSWHGLILACRWSHVRLTLLNIVNWGHIIHLKSLCRSPFTIERPCPRICQLFLSILNFMSECLKLIFQKVIVKTQILADVLRLGKTAFHQIDILVSLLILLEQSNVVLLIESIVLEVCSVVGLTSIRI